MSKEGVRKCLDCDGDDFYALFGGKGNGKCSRCHGEGIIHSFDDAFASAATFGMAKDYHTCSTCSETGQCQTCGGTGHQYYDEYEYPSRSYNEENDSSSFSSEDHYTSPNYGTDNKQNSSNNSASSTIIGWILSIIIGAIIFDNTCGNNNSKENNTVTNTSAICSDCNNTGILEISENCQYCNGRGNFECKVCNGMKTYACDNCRRVGLIRCPQCEGNINRGYIDCKQCDRKGYIVDINNNQIACPTCKGQRVYLCEKCQGYGQLNCPKCNGSQYLDCKNCKGIGNLECSHCLGNRKIYSTYTSQRCTGKRTLIKPSN